MFERNRHLPCLKLRVVACSFCMEGDVFWAEQNLVKTAIFWATFARSGINSDMRKDIAFICKIRVKKELEDITDFQEAGIKESRS